MGENEQRTCARVGILPFIKEQKKIDARGRGGAEPLRQRMRMGQAPWASSTESLTISMRDSSLFQLIKLNGFNSHQLNFYASAPFASAYVQQFDFQSMFLDATLDMLDVLLEGLIVRYLKVMMG